MDESTVFLKQPNDSCWCGTRKLINLVKMGRTWSWIFKVAQPVRMVMKRCGCLGYGCDVAALEEQRMSDIGLQLTDEVYAQR